MERSKTSPLSGLPKSGDVNFLLKDVDREKYNLFNNLSEPSIPYNGTTFAGIISAKEMTQDDLKNETNKLWDKLTELENKISKIGNDSSELISGVKNETDIIKKGVDGISKKAEETEQEVKKSSIRSMEFLAVFVALFTFISVEFQVFRSFDSWQSAAALTFLLLGGLIFFVVFLDSIINQKNNYLLLVFSLLCVFVGVWFWGSGNNVFSNDRVATKTDAVNLQQQVDMLSKKFDLLMK